MIRRLLALGFITSLALPALAGPLDPPVGPIAPTQKPLAELEPRTAINAANTPGDADSVFRIFQPGSYYLTANINGAAGKRGIEILANNVTIDLNGFALIGVPGSLDGIGSVATLTAVTIRNGTISFWGDAGIDSSVNSTGFRILDVVAAGNAGGGISVGDAAVILRCTAARNGTFGIQTSAGCTISACTSYENTAGGFITGGVCTVSDCIAQDNGQTGITVGEASSVTHSNSFSNVGDGYASGTGSLIESCVARFNDGDGIQISIACTARGNTCNSNGVGAADGAGILATGTDNRIEGNHCGNADRGIDVNNSGNIIIRNTCSDNTTDWDIVANNIYGPIIDRRAPASPVVLGFAAGSSLGSTDPNANFSH